jgi:hypothetical protein
MMCGFSVGVILPFPQLLYPTNAVFPIMPMKPHVANKAIWLQWLILLLLGLGSGLFLSGCYHY